MASSKPVRLDSEITASAQLVASQLSRSTAAQLSHWARLGRELERSPGVSVAKVNEVLGAGTGYDALSTEEQALVRAQWDERMRVLREGLDLSGKFAERGYRYAELDGKGRVVVREPRKKDPARAKRRPGAVKAAPRKKAGLRKRA